jgi:aspartyl-tRNA(Asn)/glutamyl-tRNA(Gln) amidotransferase subunit A
MTDADLAFTPATKLAPLIRRGALSPLELVQTLLARIERINPRLNAYCTVAAEPALEAARKATIAVKRRSARLGPLHGVPVSIKDLTPTAGIRFARRGAARSTRITCRTRTRSSSRG